jgi:hypothetical protein
MSENPLGISDRLYRDHLFALGRDLTRRFMLDSRRRI